MLCSINIIVNVQAQFPWAVPMPILKPNAKRTALGRHFWQGVAKAQAKGRARRCGATWAR